MKYAPRLLLALALAAGIALALVYREHLDTAALTAWITAAGLAGPLVFMAIYAVATVFFLPGSLLTLAGGALGPDCSRPAGGPGFSAPPGGAPAPASLAAS